MASTIEAATIPRCKSLYTKLNSLVAMIEFGKFCKDEGGLLDANPKLRVIPWTFHLSSDQFQKARIDRTDLRQKMRPGNFHTGGHTPDWLAWYNTKIETFIFLRLQVGESTEQ